jgi:hypothetical protein
MTIQEQMEHAHLGPLATIASLVSALFAHIIAADVALHAIASLVAILAGLMSIVHYTRLLLKKR